MYVLFRPIINEAAAATAKTRADNELAAKKGRLDNAFQEAIDSIKQVRATLNEMALPTKELLAARQREAENANGLMKDAEYLANVIAATSPDNSINVEGKRVTAKKDYYTAFRGINTKISDILAEVYADQHKLSGPTSKWKGTARQASGRHASTRSRQVW